MRLYLIRHGETDWNNEGRIQGHTNIPLNSHGIAQAEKLAAHLAGEQIDTLYTSPLARACMTAQVIGERLGLEAIPDDRLKERYLGEIEGLTAGDFEQRHPELYRQWRTSPVHVSLPGEETQPLLQRRVQTFLDDLQERHAQRADARIALVSHGGTITMFLITLLGLDIHRRSPFWLNNASLSIVDFSDQRSRVHLLNDTCHLRDDHASLEGNGHERYAK